MTACDWSDRDSRGRIVYASPTLHGLRAEHAMGCAGRARVRQLRCASSGTAIPYGDRNRVVTCLHGSIEPSRLMLRRLGKRAVAAVSRPAAGSGVGA